jgi:hypothetical protein
MEKKLNPPAASDQAEEEQQPDTLDDSELQDKDSI